MKIREQLVMLFAADNVGLTTIICISDAMAADAKFCLWFLDCVKGSASSEEEKLACLDEDQVIIERCSSAISKFHEDGDVARLEAALRLFAEQTTALANK